MSKDSLFWEGLMCFKAVYFSFFCETYAYCILATAYFTRYSTTMLHRTAEVLKSGHVIVFHMKISHLFYNMLVILSAIAFICFK